nr:hypothetical protein [Natronomonas sp. LN261]
MLKSLKDCQSTNMKAIAPAGITPTANSGRIWDLTTALICTSLTSASRSRSKKSERKSISDDLLKFQKGYRTQKDGRPKIEFGCLVVPVNYRGRDNLYRHSLTKLDFMKGILFIDDVAVIGYRIPTPD